MDNTKQDEIIYNMLFELHMKNLGTLTKLQYSKDIMTLYFQDALNQTDIKNVHLKINAYIQKGWLVCGMAGYVINPNIFEGVTYE